jgi:hypothetical protein
MPLPAIIPAAGGLVKAVAPWLLAAGSGTAVTGAVGNTVGLIPGSKEIFGTDADTVARGETYHPVKGLTGIDPGDRFRAAVSGVSLDSVEKAAKAQFVQERQLQLNNSGLTERLADLGYKIPKGGALGLAYKDKQTEEAYKLQLLNAEKKIASLEQLKAKDVDPTSLGLSLSSSAPAIQAEITRRQNEIDTVTPGTAIFESNLKETNRLQQIRENDKNRAFERAREDARYGFERAEGRADRQQNLQLAMMEGQERKLDRRYQRDADRRDRQQQSIMMLVKGLSNMGAGFAL